MQPNVGKRERFGRMAFGLIAGALAMKLRKEDPIRIPLALAALSSLMTAATRYCPLNDVLSIDNSQGNELVHFDQTHGLLKSHAMEFNQWQLGHGFRVEA